MADRFQPQAHDVEGNRLRLLAGGRERIDALVDLIDGARHSLRILYYIYAADASGRRVLDAMVAAAGRGVRVSLIVDGLGSEDAVSADFFAPLAAAGGDVCVFLPRWGRRFLLRNHQKLALADEARVIVGGFNVEDGYFADTGEGRWRDLGLLVEGPAAGRLAGYFDALSEWASQLRAPLRTLSRLLKRYSEPRGSVRWLLGGPSRRVSPWARELRHEMRRARRVDMIAGYFVPGPTTLRRLRRTARRGNVRILLSSRTDHDAAIWAARFTYRRLLNAGAQLFEYRPAMLHTKLFVIGDRVHIGSANFDVRSMFLNMELMLCVQDKAFARHARAYVEGELAASEPVTQERHRDRSGPWTRIKQAAAYFVMAVVDPRISGGLNFGELRR